MGPVRRIGRGAAGPSRIPRRASRPTVSAGPGSPPGKQQRAGGFLRVQTARAELANGGTRSLSRLEKGPGPPARMSHDATPDHRPTPGLRFSAEEQRPLRFSAEEQRPSLGGRRDTAPAAATDRAVLGGLLPLGGYFRSKEVVVWTAGEGRIELCSESNIRPLKCHDLAFIDGTENAVFVLS